MVPIVTSFHERLFPEAGDQPRSSVLRKSEQLGSEPELVASYQQVGANFPEIGDPARSSVVSKPERRGSKSVSFAKDEQVGELDKRVNVPVVQAPKPSIRKHSKRKQRDHSDSDDDYEPPKKQPDVAVHSSTRSRRARKIPAHLKEYIVGSVINTKTDIPVPKTYKQAKKCEYWTEWQAAMQEELASLRQHGTWKLVATTKAKHQRIITNRWLYTIKRDAQGRIKRFKARLVIHGFKQSFGIDYLETYAPVFRFETIRAAILYARKRGWDIMQYDIKTAFLYGLLEELIFMEIPAGSDEGAPGGDVICQLLKSLYGLKQAPAVWNKTLHVFLKSIGFTRLDSDYGLYAKLAEDKVIMQLNV